MAPAQEQQPKPASAKYLPYSMYLTIRPLVRFLFSQRRILVLFLERTVFIFPSLVKRAFCLLLSSVPAPTVSEAIRPLIQIDKVMKKSPKLWIDATKAHWRLDVTGLRKIGVSMASDMWDFHRGNLLVGGGWTKEFQHPLAKDSAALYSKQEFRYGTHETIRLMFIENRSWEETPEFEDFSRQLSLGLTPYGITSQAEVVQRGVDLRALYAHMQNEGYKESQTVGSPYWDEAHVYIDSDGDLCLGRHGNHRIAIARVLGLNRVPVLLGGIHKDFARTLGDPRHLLGRTTEYISEKFT